MRNVSLIIVSALLGFVPDPAAAQIVPVTNIEIRMLKTSRKPPLRVTAETRNPNDFAVRDIEVDCVIKDKAGKDLASYTSIVYGVFPPNQRTTTKNLNIGAWPPQGYAALCISRRGARVTPSASTHPPSAPSAPLPAQAKSPATQ